jgi:L-ribulose-5-phosphate 3-epimerase
MSTVAYLDYDFKDVTKGIREAGFKYVELLSIQGLAEHIPQPENITSSESHFIQDFCKKIDLEIFCIGGAGRIMKDNAIQNFKKVIDLARTFKVNFITTSCGHVETGEDEKRFLKEIHELADYAAINNVFICLEIHDNWFNTGKKASEIVKRINHSHVKINYDTGNIIFYGNTRPEEDIKYALPYLGFIHLKDSGGKYKGWDFPALGEGSIDFEKLFNSIKQYDGPICVEIEFDGKKYPLEYINQSAKKSFDFLKNYGYV